MIFRVWVSRRFWPWAKKYKCKGMIWCSPEQNNTPAGILLLIMPDERRVFISTAGKTITYGREFFDDHVRQAEKEAGQKLPIGNRP